jgi:signal transduction histidine kinase
VSHELRTPATAIIAIADLLLNDPDSALTGESQHAVTLVRTSAWDMLSMVNELLDVAKVEAGQVQPELRKVELHSLLGQLRGTLRPLVTSPDVQLLIEEPTDIKMLDTDDTLLTQILRNLLANALKFTDRGTVRLQVEAASHGRVRFAVADTGIGISREDQVRIFEEFYQVPNLAQVRWHGTGLGLPYAKRLVDLLGGTLTVESELGSGSVFTVELPGLDETVAAGDRVGAASSG